MPLALLMGLLIQASTAQDTPPPSAPAAVAQEAAANAAQPARAPRTRQREAANQCEFRARTGSIRRQTICQAPRQADAQSAEARRFLEDRAPVGASDINQLGPR